MPASAHGSRRRGKSQRARIISRDFYALCVDGQKLSGKAPAGQYLNSQSTRVLEQSRLAPTGQADATPAKASFAPPRGSSLHPTNARRTPPSRQNGRCYQRLPLRARRRPQGASRFPRRASRGRPRAVFRRQPDARVSPNRPQQRNPFGKPDADDCPPPRAFQVTARRSFLGKGVAGLAPVRYVRARIDRALERVPAAANPDVTPDRVRIVRGARPQILIRVRTPLDRSRRRATTRAINPASRR